MGKTRYILLGVNYLQDDGYLVNGAIIKVDSKFLQRIEEYRSCREVAEYDLEFPDRTPIYVKDFQDQHLNDVGVYPMDDGWTPEDVEVEEVEDIVTSIIHVGRNGVFWTFEEDGIPVRAETVFLPYETIGLRTRRKTKAFAQIYKAQRKLWQKEHSLRFHVPSAVAKVVRPWLKEHPETEWVRVEVIWFGDELGPKVTLSNGVTDAYLEDELTSYFSVYSTMKEGDFIRVTRDKIYVKKGWYS